MSTLSRSASNRACPSSWRASTSHTSAPTTVNPGRRSSCSTRSGEKTSNTASELIAGTTLIARVNGDVKHIVAKPLPLIAPAAGDVDANYVHEFGVDRLEKMKRFFDQVEDDDALSVWKDEPAVNRLDFASLHYDDGMPSEEARS